MVAVASLSDPEPLRVQVTPFVSLVVAVRVVDPLGTRFGEAAATPTEIVGAMVMVIDSTVTASLTEAAVTVAV